MGQLNIDIEEFLDKDIFTLLHLEKAPKKKKDAIMADMLETIQNRVSMSVLDKLSEQEIDTLETLIDQGQKEQVDNFLDNKGFDLARIVSEETMKYKIEIVKLIQTKKGA